MKSRLLLKVAYICWSVPLLLAVADLIGFWLTRDPFFLHAGLLLLVLGFLAMILGGICLAIFSRENRGANGPTRKAVETHLGLAFCLLVTNVFLAVPFVVVGSLLASQLYFHIVNASSRPLDHVTLLSRGSPKELGPLAAGQEKKVYFNPWGGGETGVEIQVSQGNETRQAVISGYVEGLGGEDRRITIAEDLSITVESLR